MAQNIENIKNVIIGIRVYVVDLELCQVWTERRGKMKQVTPHTPKWYEARQIAKGVML
jgi:hypothetical protein